MRVIRRPDVMAPGALLRSTAARCLASGSAVRGPSRCGVLRRAVDGVVCRPPPPPPVRLSQACTSRGTPRRRCTTFTCARCACAPPAPHQTPQPTSPHGPSRTRGFGMQRSRAWCGTPPILGVVNMVGTRNFTCYMGAL